MPVLIFFFKKPLLTGFFREKYLTLAHSDCDKCSAATMSARRTTPFQNLHCLQFGLAITRHDLKKGVTCVQCEFCVYDGRTRARTNDIPLLTPPYCPAIYRKH